MAAKAIGRVVLAVLSLLWAGCARGAASAPDSEPQIANTDSDTGASCGNFTCEATRGETCASCSDDCGICCGNGTCEAGIETCATCSDDCGSCTVFFDNFSDCANSAWAFVIGNWSSCGGVGGFYYARSASRDPPAVSLVSTVDVADFVLEVDRTFAIALSNTEEFGLFLRAADPDNAVVLVVRSDVVYWSVRQLGVWGPRLNSAPLPAFPGRNIRITITAIGSTYSASLSDGFATGNAIDLEDSTFTRGQVGVYSYSNIVDFDNVRVTIVP